MNFVKIKLKYIKYEQWSENIISSFMLTIIKESC